jgi:hypothetical protein
LSVKWESKSYFAGWSTAARRSGWSAGRHERVPKGGGDERG